MSWGLIGALAGAALAPFTGGASLMMSAAAGAGIGGMIDQYQAGKKAASLQEQAMSQAMAQQKAAADQAYNAANRKSPNIAGLLGSAMLASKGGNAGTMLTGPTGVDTKSLTLGRTTLLGG